MVSILLQDPRISEILPFSPTHQAHILPHFILHTGFWTGI